MKSGNFLSTSGYHEGVHEPSVVPQAVACARGMEGRLGRKMVF